jgi:glycosyltransferase involved in cell wall biosynthesis
VKILVTLTYYHPHWTGLTVIAQHLAEGLAARGHAVTVLASQHDRDLPRREEVNGVEVIRVPSLGRVSRTAVMPSYPATLARLTAGSEIVHLHTPMPEAALVVGQARLLRRPSLITHQGDVVMPAGLANRVIQQAMDTSLGLAMRLSDGVTVHAADYARHSPFLAPFAHRIQGIYPPVVLPAPRSAAARSWRHQLGLADKPLIGFAGRFVEEKGFDFLLEAIPLVRSRLPEAHFVFAGDTDIAYERFFERCRHLVEGQGGALSRLGLLRDRQQMADFYAMCDVFVLPSRSDSFAAVQVEALLSGTPLVSTDIPGAREVVRATGAGRSVPPGDPVALADGIVEVLTNPSPYQPAPAAVRAVFDPERSVREYEDLMLRLVGGRLGRRFLRREPAMPRRET